MKSKKNKNNKWSEWLKEVFHQHGRVPATKNMELSGLPRGKALKKGRDGGEQTVNLSPYSVFQSALVLLGVSVGAYLVYQMGGILLMFFVAFFVAAALDPLIDWLQKMKIPRALGVLLVYVFIFVLVALLFAHLLPLIAQQLFSLAVSINEFVLKLSQTPTANLPFGPTLKSFLDELYRAVDIKIVAEQLQSSLQVISGQILNLGGNLWFILLQLSNGLFNFLLILIVVFFMTVDEMAIENFCTSIFPSRHMGYVTERLRMVKMKIGEWIRGQLMVSVVAAVITFVGLVVAGVEFALLIAVITGICMIVPVFGRVVAAVLVLPIVINQSPGLGLYLIVYYFAVSWLENNILVPVLMNKAVGLSPLVIIFALMVGFQLLGVLGLVLAIPIATILSIFVSDVGRRIHAGDN